VNFVSIFIGCYLQPSYRTTFIQKCCMIPMTTIKLLHCPSKQNKNISLKAFEGHRK
jgi:hypothetical protein